MKNITPKAGQVWELKEQWSMLPKGYEFIIDAPESCLLPGIADKRSGISFSEQSFLSMFKYVPANDLEWLACHLDKWYFAGAYLYKDNGAPMMCSNPSLVCHECYTRQQHQNMRYELGLDEKPHVEYVTDPKTIHEMFNGVYNKKEAKMIDLSSAKVGDEFEYFGEIAKISYIHGAGERFVLDVENGVIVCNKKGEGCTSIPFQLIKHDPRPWLKDLPDADIFRDEVKWIRCSEKNGYWYSCNNAVEISLGQIKMPTLTGDQWKDSKISIDELREWQGENK